MTETERKTRRTGKRAESHRAPSRGSNSAPPLPPRVGSEVVLGDRAVEDALDSDSKVRCALTRLAAAVLDGKVERARANAATFIINGIAQRLDREFDRQARVRELDLKEREIAEAARLATALEAHRAQQPGLVNAVQVLVGGDADVKGSQRPALVGPQEESSS